MPVSVLLYITSRICLIDSRENTGRDIHTHFPFHAGLRADDEISSQASVISVLTLLAALGTQKYIHGVIRAMPRRNISMHYGGEESACHAHFAFLVVRFDTAYRPLIT